MNATQPIRLTRDEIAVQVYAAVVGYCKKYAPPRDAEDLAQIVMVKLLLRADRIDQDRPDFNPVALAFGIAKYTIMNARQSGWRLTSFTDLAGGEDDGHQFDPAQKNEVSNAQEERRPKIVNRVRAALGELTPKHRRLIDARYLRGLSRLRIAASVGEVPERITRRLSHARRECRDALTRFGFRAGGVNELVQAE